MTEKLKGKKILVTGGAGFIGSNLCESLLKLGVHVTCLDNFSTGSKNNLLDFVDSKNFNLIEGDIRDLNTCKRASKNQNYILHQAALGSVPRSITDPITTNDVNIGGFLNMLVAAHESKIERFIYAASSSTYGDSYSLPKIENQIGKPLSPYAITKYVNELYAENFNLNYNLDTIGLRYFNVFGPKQNPNGPYAAVIPLFIKKLTNYESPVINGDGSFSRDFTFINNVIQMNILALTTDDKIAINQVYNTAVGERTTLIEMFLLLKKYLSKHDPRISQVEVKFGPERLGDIPHSLASMEKANKLLNYSPSYTLEQGIEMYVEWYIKNNNND
jgi:UDP-N-acetylglucosamine 4-epimerase